MKQNISKPCEASRTVKERRKLQKNWIRKRSWKSLGDLKGHAAIMMVSWWWEGLLAHHGPSQLNHFGSFVKYKREVEHNKLTRAADDCKLKKNIFLVSFLNVFQWKARASRLPSCCKTEMTQTHFILWWQTEMRINNLFLERKELFIGNWWEL